jgi:hypothetical protein
VAYGGGVKAGMKKRDASSGNTIVPDLVPDRADCQVPNRPFTLGFDESPRGVLPVALESRAAAESGLDVVNRLVEGAEEAGVGLRLRSQDGEVVDLSGRYWVAVEWVLPSGDTHFVGDARVAVRITEAAEMLGMSRRALYRRVLRAHQAGEPMPFSRNDDPRGRPEYGDGTWCAHPEAVKEWAAQWTGRRAIRSSQSLHRKRIHWDSARLVPPD